MGPFACTDAYSVDPLLSSTPYLLPQYISESSHSTTPIMSKYVSDCYMCFKHKERMEEDRERIILDGLGVLIQKKKKKVLCRVFWNLQNRIP